MDNPPSKGVIRSIVTAGNTYVLLVFLLLGGAGFFRFRLPQEPFIDPDIGGYLNPAVTALTHRGFQHLEGRSFVYPGFIYLILKTFQDLRAISVIQHLLGLATGGILLTCWNCSRMLIQKPAVPITIHHLLGLLVAALFLFNTSVVRFEHLIRPEAVFPFFAVLNILFNIQFIRYRYLEPNSRGALLYGSLNLFNAFLLVFLKPSFFLATAFATLPIWISFLDPKEPLRRKIQLIGTAGISITVLLFLPEQSLKRTDPMSKTFLPTTLFVVHANIIADQLIQDVQDQAETPYPPEFLAKTYALLNREIQDSRQTAHYKSLGFDPDYLMYRDSFNQKFLAYLGPPDPEAGEVKFYYYYFFRTWIHQPGAMLKKVVRQLGILYNNIAKASPYKTESQLKLSEAYANTGSVLDAKASLSQIHYEPLANFIAGSNQLANTKVRLLQPTVVSAINAFLARTFSLSIILTLAIAVMVANRPPLRKSYGWFLGTTLLLYTYSFGNTLGIAIVHSLEITRYLTNQLAYCLLPQSMTILLAIEVFCLPRVRFMQDASLESAAHG